MCAGWQGDHSNGVFVLLSGVASIIINDKHVAYITRGQAGLLPAGLFAALVVRIKRILFFSHISHISSHISHISSLSLSLTLSLSLSLSLSPSLCDTLSTTLLSGR